MRHTHWQVWDAPASQQAASRPLPTLGRLRRSSSESARQKRQHKRRTQGTEYEIDRGKQGAYRRDVTGASAIIGSPCQLSRWPCRVLSPVVLIAQTGRWPNACGFARSMMTRSDSWCALTMLRDLHRSSRTAASTCWSIETAAAARSLELQAG